MVGGPRALPLTELVRACTVTCLAAVLTSEYAVCMPTSVLRGTLRFHRNCLSTARLCYPMSNFYHAKRRSFPLF